MTTETNCIDCEGKGYIHIRTDKGKKTIEKCDTCRKYDTDGIASTVHSRQCTCGALSDNTWQ